MLFENLLEHPCLGRSSTPRPDLLSLGHRRPPTLSLMKVQAYPWRWLPTPSPCPSPAVDTPLPPLTLGTLPFHPFRDWQKETLSLFPVGSWGPGSPYRRKAGKAGPQRERGRKKMPGRSPRGLLRYLGLDLIVLGAWPWARDTGVPASSSPSQGPASLAPSPRVLTQSAANPSVTLALTCTVYLTSNYTLFCYLFTY